MKLCGKANDKSGRGISDSISLLVQQLSRDFEGDRPEAAGLVMSNDEYGLKLIGWNWMKP